MIPIIPIIGLAAVGVLLDSIFSNEKQNVVVTPHRKVKSVVLPKFYHYDSINSWVKRNSSWLTSHCIYNQRCAAHLAKDGKKWYYI